MTLLLSLDEVRAVLGLASDRQVKRLATGPDPLPILYLNRKAPRVHPDDLEAWLARRRLTQTVSSAYTSSHDWRGDAAAATAGGPLSTKARHQAGPPLEQRGPARAPPTHP